MKFDRSPCHEAREKVEKIKAGNPPVKFYASRFAPYRVLSVQSINLSPEPVKRDTERFGRAYGGLNII